MRECVSLLMVLFFYFFSSFLSIFLRLHLICSMLFCFRFVFVHTFVVFLSNRMSSSKNCLLLWFDSIPFHSILLDMWFSLQSLIYFMRHDTRSYALCPQFQLFYNKLACYLMLIIKVDRVRAKLCNRPNSPYRLDYVPLNGTFSPFQPFHFSNYQDDSNRWIFFDGIFYFNRSTNIQNSFALSY